MDASSVARYYALRQVTTPPSAEYSSIQDRSVPVHPQSDSFLYNGRIPAEIRNAIFECVLTEYTKDDDHHRPGAPLSRYPVDTHYTRPHYTGKKAVNVALLRSCRRVYLETYRMPFANKEIIFYHSRGPPAHAGTTLLNYGQQEIDYFGQFLPWQMALVKETHLFTQAFWLEETFPQIAPQEFMQGIEKIKITLRRGDWWYWEYDSPLKISPQSGSVTGDLMHTQWVLEKQGGIVPWDPSQWGSAFARMKGLKQLELEFETSDDKKHELKSITINALSWKFPAHSIDGVEMVFSPGDIVPKWTTWDGPMCYWSNRCRGCGQLDPCPEADFPKESCVERSRRRAEGLGPLCHIVRLKYKIGLKDARS